MMSIRHVGLGRSWGLIAMALAGVLTARATAVPVTIEVTAVRTIQAANAEQGDAADQVYVVATGVAAGKEFSVRAPESGAMKSAPKEQPVPDKKPIVIWKGELDNGQFALASIGLMVGPGKDAAKGKEFIAKIAEANKKATSKATLGGDEFKALAGITDIKRPQVPEYVKAQRQVVSKVKAIDPTAKDAEQYAGLFTILVFNDNGKIIKKLDPVGLTFGEHYGTDLKTYTKLKNTRGNVMIKDDTGDWTNTPLPPLSDDQGTVRVKMLQTIEPKGPDSHHTTDYLVETQVITGGKAVQWTLGGESPGIDDIHTYWDFAY